jgi:hypothetical protein
MTQRTLYRWSVKSPSGYEKTVWAESKWEAIDRVRTMELNEMPTFDGLHAYSVNAYIVKKLH